MNAVTTAEHTIAMRFHLGANARMPGTSPTQPQRKPMTTAKLNGMGKNAMVAGARMGVKNSVPKTVPASNLSR